MIKDYCQGIEYKDGEVEAVYVQEGRLTAVYDEYGVTLTRFRAEYWLKDHPDPAGTGQVLGNTRLAFADENHNGTIEVWDDPSTQENEAEITQAKRSGVPYRRKEVGKNHYYPFGMNHEGPWYATIDPRNGYQYNGKELNEELELDWNDYGARWYDASIGRWNAVDLLCSQTPNWSVYHYVYNNPINYLDILGLSGGNPNDYYDRSRQKVQDKFDSAAENNESENNSGQYNFPKAYYTNAANLSTSELVSIFNNAANIFSKNGFDGITFISVDIEEAKAHKQTYEYQMFLAIISKKELNQEVYPPGNSLILKNGRIGVYDEEIIKSRYPYNGFLSWVNISNSTIEKHKGNKWYAAGYIVAHEILHQLVAIAAYYQYKDVYNYPQHVSLERLHLNSPGESTIIPSGPSNKIRDAEKILDCHIHILNFYKRE